MGTEPLHIDVVDRPDGVVVIGTGEMDIVVSDEFDGAMDRAVELDRQVVVDLRDASFIDSAVLQSLASHAKGLAGRGEKLKVMVVEDSYPAFVLKLVGFDCLMDVENVQAARSGD